MEGARATTTSAAAVLWERTCWPRASSATRASIALLALMRDTSLLRSSCCMRVPRGSDRSRGFSTLAGTGRWACWEAGRIWDIRAVSRGARAAESNRAASLLGQRCHRSEHHPPFEAVAHEGSFPSTARQRISVYASGRSLLTPDPSPWVVERRAAEDHDGLRECCAAHQQAAERLHTARR